LCGDKKRRKIRTQERKLERLVRNSPSGKDARNAVDVVVKLHESAPGCRRVVREEVVKAKKKHGLLIFSGDELEIASEIVGETNASKLHSGTGDLRFSGCGDVGDFALKSKISIPSVISVFLKSEKN
jgi:hypothetical protein